MLQCDWCHKPIRGDRGKGWGYEIKLTPFHSLGLGRGVADGPAVISVDAHLHPKPCKDELAWAVQDLLKDREPLETDGPGDGEEPEPDLAGDSSSAETRRVREAQEQRRERFERDLAWKRIPTTERQRVLLHVLADDQLTIREITEQMREELPHCDLYEDSVGRLVRCLFKGTRDLDRRPDPRKKGTVRYRYFRRELEGPIADLERTFHEEGD